MAKRDIVPLPGRQELYERNRYSPAVRANGLLFVSGQVGVGADGQAADGIEAQTRTAVENLKRVLSAAGMTLDDVAKYTFFLTDPADAQGFAEGAVEMLQNPPAAVTMIFVSALAAPNLKVEIECVAAK